MQCVTPMFRRYERGDHSKGTIVPRTEVMDSLEFDPNYIRHCLDDINSYSRRSNGRYLYEQIPCGHCWACRLNYSAQWAGRIIMECKKSEHNYFITFTYDEEHLPIPESADYNGVHYENDGTWTGTLFPSDINRFLNSLRKHLERDKNHTGVKYFYAGEYCPSSGRPHYHMILMNCPLDIEQFHDFFKDDRLKLHWKSYELEKYWDKGFIDIGEVEFASAAYVARYCMKKITDNVDKADYYSQGKEPEFVRMSRRPGIGTDYFNEHFEDIYKYDKITVKNFHGETITVKPSKSWDRKFEKLFPTKYHELKQSRKAAAERSRRLLKELTDATDLQILEQNAEKILIKGKQLPREGTLCTV